LFVGQENDYTTNSNYGAIFLVKSSLASTNIPR